MFPDISGPIAQSVLFGSSGQTTIVERRTYNAEVVGSSPTRTTIRIAQFSTEWFISNILPAKNELPI